MDKSIKRPMKVLPDGITLAANESLPIRDKCSRFVHFLRPVQKSNNGINSSSFSEGRLTAIVIVSINMPRKTKLVVGPIIFSGARGTTMQKPALLFPFVVYICQSLPHWLRKNRLDNALIFCCMVVR